MTLVKNGSVSSYAAVAVIAALISAVGMWGATQFVATSSAQFAAGGAGQLLTQPLADLPGREVRISLLDREPGSISARLATPDITHSDTSLRGPTSLESTASPAAP
jgi:hypothetical protein